MGTSLRVFSRHEDNGFAPSGIVYSVIGVLRFVFRTNAGKLGAQHCLVERIALRLKERHGKVFRNRPIVVVKTCLKKLTP
eukprot:m.526870 g.526870  ORF g.526870 m.526870 type:complete len:80 (+) comp57556_c0_seq4:1420-1659(+)